MIGAYFHIRGIVQGVGFRPFVYNLATSLGLSGWVKNTSSGVEIELDGQEDIINEFSHRLKKELPPLAQIDEFNMLIRKPNGHDGFKIIPSEAIPQTLSPISPDVSVCQDCLNELFDPSNRRFLYPFINCTNCGPRFTIIKDIPYDRPFTTMAEFKMCEACDKEYQDPTNRRFHAQPIACPDCGPQIWLENPEGTHLADGIQTVQLFQDYIKAGLIIAIKGIGGFHLACDALNSSAIERLRYRKHRVDKPFALMFPDLKSVKNQCHISPQETDLLLSRQRPIVLLYRKETSEIPQNIAPGQNTLGVMLPYTPLHYMLFMNQDILTQGQFLSALVMTSGNISEEPIATQNEEAIKRLSGIADFFLMHNRPIFTRCDDSVIRVVSEQNFPRHGNTKQNQIYPLRKSRGYSPSPIKTNWKSPPLLACGPELKNTFCLSKDSYAFVSHHIGDLENYETLRSYEEGIDHYQRLFKIKPEILAYDLHPDYLATRYAIARAQAENLPVKGIQHHHAHIAACMAENLLPEDSQVIGISFDGTGYGTDGAIWGGEFIVATYSSFSRAASLKYVPLPGGDRAIREPWRMALSWLHAAKIDWDDHLPPVKFLKGKKIAPEIFREILNQRMNAPDTSSMGRLFDAVSSLIGIRQEANYEAQAAIEFEAFADPDENAYYQFELFSDKDSNSIIIDPSLLFKQIISDVSNHLPIPFISAKFHSGISEMVREVCLRLKYQYGITDVVLSGGVWQNMLLLHKSCSHLLQEGFKVWTHSRVPANDGGISLGQAAIAGHIMVG
jgi:hydrogenase maturation protein HypF